MYLSSVSKRKRALEALYRVDPILKEDEFICLGNYLFSAITANGENTSILIPEKFRNAYYFANKSPKIKGEVRCLLSDEQVLGLSSHPNWPKAFVHLPKGRRQNPENGAYLDANMLPPSDSEEDDKDSQDSSDKSEEN